MTRMKIVCDATGCPTPHDGRFLQFYDADANGGRGEIRTTAIEAEAIQFRDAGEAGECWKRISTVWPVRFDGKPNRPLTAYTVEMI